MSPALRGLIPILRSSKFSQPDRDYLALKEFDRDNLEFIEIVRDVQRELQQSLSKVSLPWDDFLRLARVLFVVRKVPRDRRFSGFYGC